MLTEMEELTGKVLAPIELLKNLMLGIVAAGGVIVLIWGIVDIIGVISSHQKDVAQIMNGIFKVGGGIVLLLIGSVIGLFTN